MFVAESALSATRKNPKPQNPIPIPISRDPNQPGLRREVAGPPEILGDDVTVLSPRNTLEGVGLGLRVEGYGTLQTVLIPAEASRT